MIIIGAGMAGLLAGGMIRDENVTIIESSSTIPNNHSAVLRFRSHAVGDALDIEFKQVDMLKCIHHWRNTVADSLAYSLKCNGSATLRSILSADSSLNKRFIAPSDLVQRMVNRIGSKNIQLGKSYDFKEAKTSKKPIISTIPMPTLMGILGWDEKPEFKYVHGFNINATVENCDAYVSVYVPDPVEIFNRVSLTGSKMTIECSLPDLDVKEINCLVQEYNSGIGTNEILREAKYALGIDNQKVSNVSISMQRYSKILPIDDNIRKRFIMWASEKFNIYSLGRFATWRPGLLLDDVVNDVRVIRKIIKNGSYDHKKQM